MSRSGRAPTCLVSSSPSSSGVRRRPGGRTGSACSPAVRRSSPRCAGPRTARPRAARSSRTISPRPSGRWRASSTPGGAASAGRPSSLRRWCWPSCCATTGAPATTRRWAC
ncbi:hypothetical protein [Ornithinimicrobium kibberense]|uniref:hypothetical protein n=1 Tax=Ornithinimicrobium kibberense TaxID=282060 RepID=UPI00361EB4D1